MHDFRYPKIDIKRTGRLLKRECLRQNYSVKDIQHYLQIGAYQSIYAWFNGKSLPSLDNMFALSRLLGKSVEELIVCQDEVRYADRDRWIFGCPSRERVLAYCDFLFGEPA